MDDIEWAIKSQQESKKLKAFYECYPMVKHVDDPLHRITWETFSFIWDKAVKSMACKNQG